MSDSSSGVHPLDALAEEFVARHRRGERPSVSEYADRYPELADDIRDLFPGLVVMEDVRPQADATGPFRAFPPGPAPDRLGDYRLLQEVGRGGMGVVYEAEQVSLGRHVALKVLPAHGLLSPTFLERFRREAKAAARLHHTNIVPVYGVGEADGTHYYAMQFIQGQSLEQVLHDVRRLRQRPGDAAGADGTATGLDGSAAQGLLTGQFAAPSADPGSAGVPPASDRGAAGTPALPGAPPTAPWSWKHAGAGGRSSAGLSAGGSEAQYFRSVARAGLQAADALAYAHRQGVLHRDVKPSNVLLDLQGTVWITDFGLAKAEGSDELTQTGDIVGTVRFMAPERFDGRSLPQGDVYGLGLTLYEMLTLRPAFSDSSRARLIEKVLHDPPLLPRRIDPHIPRDLETIVLKCLAKDPAGRYATAEALAEDLRRFLSDRPVRATRASLTERTWRWCRRNPTVASLTAAVAVLLVCIAAGSLATAVWAVKANEDLKNQHAATLAEQRRAERAEREARESGLNAYVAARDRARAARFSRRMGQRYDTLRAVAEAAKVARQLNLPEERIRELRNEAIACLALPDLRVAREWDGCPQGSVDIAFDGALERYSRLDLQGNVSLRRVADDREVRCLAVGPGKRWLSLSQDGRYLAAGGQGRLQVWDLAGPKPVQLLEAPELAFEFSPDSRQFVLADADNGIGVYELPSGRRLRRLEPGPRPLLVAIHPTERKLAVAHNTGVQVRDLETGKVLASFPHIGDPYAWTAWHPDGKILATVGGDRVIRLWDVATGKEIVRMEGTRNGGINFTFNHRGDLLASNSWEGILRLWDTWSGKQVLSAMYPFNYNRRQFSPDDRFLFGGIKGIKVQIVEVAGGREYRTLVRDPVLGQGFYQDTAVSGDGRLLAAGALDGFGLWDLPSGKPLAFVRQRRTSATLFEPDGGLLTYGIDGLWRWPVKPDPASPSLFQVGPPQVLLSAGAAAGFSSSWDGRVIAAGELGRGSAVVLYADRLVGPVRLVHGGDVWGASVSPDGLFVATGCQHAPGVKVWEAETGKLVRVLLPQQTGCKTGFSPDGRWLATTSEGHLRLWSVGSWQEALQIDGGGNTIFSPDGKLLAADDGQGAIRLINPDTGRDYARLEDPNQDRGRLSFSPDGTQLISSTQDSQSIHVWDLRAIRRQLAEMGLDWDLLPYPSLDNKREAAPLRVTVDFGKLAPAPKPPQPSATDKLRQEVEKQS
jgi:serine/threonine protein kinase/WD40 repeat protein